MKKHVQLEEETRILLNKAKSKYLKDNPQTKKYTDDHIIRTSLKNYLG